MKDFNDKTAVITGGASGIGRAMGELFQAKGMNVVLADIEQNALDATVAALAAGGGKCIGVVTDVSKAEDVQRLADTAMAEFGAIHIACNNAGVFAGGLLWEESLADFARRRFGKEAFERLIAPLIAGIYTADPEQLSLKATLPRFIELESRYGSVVRGLMQQVKAK